MPGALPDVLSSDGQFVYMRHMRFNLAGAEQEPDVTHLFSPAGFLDDSWWHRTYWLYGTDMSSGWGGWLIAGRQAPAGRLLVLDESFVYGFGRLNQYDRHGSHVGLDGLSLPWPPPPTGGQPWPRTQYYLFACAKSPNVIETHTKQDQKNKNKRSARSMTQIECRWSESVGLWVRAMVLADKTLFMAGPPDVFSRESQIDKRQVLLYAVSAEDGKKLAEYKLESPPVFDGMIAANGRLYISTQDGRLLCMGKNK